MKINNIKIRTQFMLGLIIPMLFVIVLGVVAYIQASRLHSQDDILYHHHLLVGRAIGMLRSDIYAINRDMKDLSRATGDGEISGEIAWIKWWIKDASEHIDTISSNYLGPRKDVDLLKQDFDSLKKICEATLELMISGKKDEVFSLSTAVSIMSTKIEPLLEKLQVINVFAIKKGDELYEQSEKIYLSLNKQLFLLVAVILLFSLIINFVLFRNISKPLTELTAVAQRFHKGDKDARSSYVSQNEFGVLSASFNSLAETALRVETMNMEAVFESSPVAMFVIDETTNIVLTNLAFEVMCGSSESEILQHRPGNALRCVHSHKDPRGCGYSNDCKFCNVRNGVEALIANGGSLHGAELELELTRNGKPGKYWMNIGAEPFMIGGRQRWCIAMDNITERKQAEEELIVSNERFRLAMNASNDGLFDWNLETNEIYYSPAWKKMLGYEYDELPNDFSVWEKTTEPEDVKKSWELQQKLISKQIDRFELEFKMKHKAGHWVYILSQAEAIFNEDGKAIRIVGTHTDITERKRAEKALHESEERFRSLYENSTIGLYRTTPDGKIILANPTLVKMLGHSSFEELTERNLEKEGYEASYERKYFIEQMEKNGEVVGFESAWTKKDGTVANIRESARAIRDSGGKILFYDGTVEDITKRKHAEEQLLLLSQQNELILSSMAEGIMEFDLQGDSTFINAAASKMLGYKAEEFLGRPSHSTWHHTKPDGNSYPREECPINATLLNGMVHLSSTEEFWRKDGTSFPVEYTSTPILKHGQLVGAVVTFSDITERKRAESSLRESKQIIEDIINTIPVRVFWKDRDLVYLGCNTRFAQDAGFTDTKDVIGKDDYQMIWRDQAELYRNDDRKVIEIGSSKLLIEEPQTTPDGKTITLLTSKIPLRNSGGEIIGILGTYMDITDRKLAEEALKQSEEQFRLISENVADLIAVLDLKGRRIYNSPSYKNILGDTNELRGTDSFREIHPDDREKIKAIFKETVKTGVGQRAEYRFVKPDGKVFTVESQGSVIRDKDGKVTNVVVVSRDVTEKKLLDQQFMRMQRMENIGTLAGGVAHDLNNVLAPIMLSIEILKKAMPDERSQRMLETLETSAHRGSAIIKQILGFARGVKGESVLIQIRHIITEMVNIIKETFPKSITMKEDIPKNIWTIVGDPTNLHQVILNLCVNARDAMPDGGTISIKAENKLIDEQYARMNIEAKLGNYVMLSVEDTGCGMSSEVLEHIFEPFFTTKEIGKGTGLGLSTVHSIVKNHGGFINVYSEVGKGTTFRVYLPAAKESGDVKEELKKSLNMFMGHEELILVVDDEYSIQQITKNTLEVYGYRTLTASDGTEAIAQFALRKDEVALVLTDMMMPVMDGQKTIRVLRKMNPAIKIIASSGLASKDDVVVEKGLAVDAFLVKPYNAEKLLETVYSVLHKK